VIVGVFFSVSEALQAVNQRQKTTKTLLGKNQKNGTILAHRTLKQDGNLFFLDAHSVVC
jgi:hypothetical protein